LCQRGENCRGMFCPHLTSLSAESTTIVGWYWGEGEAVQIAHI
jgi:hypothetical protein